ncbi:hypothetical protein RDV84_11580 [Lysobacter yananisis]|uniref:DUF1761 domain-containing protein n=1 Tax=Lysobacter yananisis TaxID=1003114 RepID=A0ABY9PEG1_9GAMM|nr:hypothetical protein [Lysobacter yananisis]WMT05452.1 hypothetical protein RDV84_11580 [Lysobacter yananisis]
MDIAMVGKVVLAALCVALVVVALFLFWLQPVAWVLRRLAPRALGAPLRDGAAMVAVQFALMSMMPAALTWGLFGAQAPPWAQAVVVAALPWLGLVLGLRLAVRDGERGPLSWPRACLLAVPAALAWWLATALVLSVPLLLGWLTPPMLLGG